MGLFDDVLQTQTPNASPAPRQGLFDDVLKGEGNVVPNPGTNPVDSGRIGLFDDVLKTPTVTTSDSTPTSEDTSLPVDVPSPQAPQPQAPGAVMRGLYSGTFQNNPEVIAGGLEMSAHAAPEDVASGLRSGATWLREQAKRTDPAYAMQSPPLKDIWADPSFEKALTWTGETFGQGLASMAPNLVAAGLGGLVGSPAGPVGTAVGAGTGAGFTGFLMNGGEVYNELIKNGVEPERAAKWAAAAGVPMAALDMVVPVSFMSRVLGLGEVKKEVARAIARRVVRGGIKDATKEGMTELAQEAVKIGANSLATGMPFWTEDNAWSMLENGLGGVIVGGPMGAASHVRSDKTAPKGKPTTEQDWQQATPVPPTDPTIPTPDPAPNLLAPTPEAGPTFYSVAERAVRDKGPSSADGAQWLSTIKNAGVKEEEIQQLGLEDFLAQQEGKVSKADVLAHIEERQIQVEEVIKSPQEVPKGIEGWTNPNPPGDVQYAEYQTPGPSKNYRELLLTLPTAESRRDQENDVSPLERGPNTFQSRHWGEPNVLAHIRFSEREDATGAPVLHVQEIQSDWHQTGRKTGYRSERLPGVKSENYVTPTSALVPDAPFKSSWPDLAIKRMIRYAADNGYARLTFATAEQQTSFHTMSAEQQKGNKEFYNKILPSKLRYWAKKVGGRVKIEEVKVDTQLLIPTQAAPGRWGLREGSDPTTPVLPLFEPTQPDKRFYVNNKAEVEAWLQYQGATTGLDKVFAIELTPDAVTNVQQRGLPLYNVTSPDVTISMDEGIALGPRTAFYSEVHRAAEAIKEIARKFKFNHKLEIRITTTLADPSWGGSAEVVNGSYRIKIDPTKHKNISEVWSTLTHELGHIIVWDKFLSAPDTTKRIIRAEYTKWRRANARDMSVPLGEMLQSRDSFNSARAMNGGFDITRTIGSMTPEQRKYWLDFHEFMAEQVSRWASTTAEPITVFEKWVSGVSKALLDLLTTVVQKYARTDWSTTPTIQSWLDSYMKEDPSIWAKFMEEMDRKSKAENQRHMGPATEAVPEQDETVGVKEAVRKALPPGPTPPEVAEAFAWVDKFNWLYKMGLSVIQVAKRNPHIMGLQKYVELLRAMHRDEHRIQDAALRVSKQWRGLGQKQADAVSLMLDDVKNMTYRTDDEIKAGVARHPTAAELQEIARRRGVNTEGQKVYLQVKKMFDDFLTIMELQSRAEALKIQDIVKQTAALKSSAEKYAALRSIPYFPAMRFGSYTLTVRDKAGKLLHFETTEAHRFGVPRLLKEPKVSQLKRGKDLEAAFPDAVVTAGYLDEEVLPLVGLPRGLLEMMEQKLQLSDTQKDLLEQLKFDVSPAQSFKHRFQHRKDIPGYSMNFQRAFAQYFFHGARYYSHVKYADTLQQQIREVKIEGGFLKNRVKRDQIVNFMRNHYKEVMNPAKDFAFLRSAVFMWALAFVPAAATMNMSQLIVGTLPFLSSKFGDIKTMNAMLKTGAGLENFYKRGKYDGSTAFHDRAFSEAIKQGVITEAMAPEIAAIADGKSLGQGFGGNVAQQGLTWFMEKGALMFEMTEQFNRRITFRAALELALADPANKHVNDAVRSNPILVRRLQDEGWSEAEARAYAVAQDAVDTTQFTYSKWGRPRFMRGRLGTLFVFKMFTQSTLFFLWNNPGARGRALLTMMALYGVMGLPGADDIDDLIEGLAYKIFGKDFSPKQELRKLIVDLAKGVVPPDLVLHGMARRGFGIPALLDYAGNTVGRGDPDLSAFRFKYGRTPTQEDVDRGIAKSVPDKAARYPIFDRSRAGGMGTILPFSPGDMMKPTKDQSRMLSDQIQNVSGAAFGAIFNIMKAVTDGKLDADDPKRWERAVPRALGNLSKSYRAMTEGRERNRSGSTVLPYDMTDPEQVFEAIGMGMGYNNLRTSAHWDRVIAEKDAITFWDMKRQKLLMDFYKSKDDPKLREAVTDNIAKFNRELPEAVRPKAITGDTIRRSVTSRERAVQAQESGVDVIKTNRLLQQEIQKQFPESTIDVRRVR